MPTSDKTITGRSALLELLNSAGETALAQEIEGGGVAAPRTSTTAKTRTRTTPRARARTTTAETFKTPTTTGIGDEALLEHFRQKIPGIVPSIVAARPALIPTVETSPKSLTEELLRGPKMTLSGMAGTVEGMAGGIEWLTGSETARDLADKARGWQKDLQPTDPNFLDAVNSGFGSAVTFFVPGAGVGFGTAKLASISTRLALYFGVAVSTALEAMTEAGMTYREVLEDTGEKTQAEDAAQTTFWLNVPLVAITNKFGVFGEQGKLLTKGLVSSALEATQETLQEVISRKAGGQPVTPGALATAAGVGAITGGAMGTASSGIFHEGKTEPTAPAEQPEPVPTPEELQSHAQLLKDEKAHLKAVTTEGSSVFVKLPDSEFEELRNGVFGKIIKPAKDLMGEAVVSLKLEGHPVTRVYSALNISPVTPSTTIPAYPPTTLEAESTGEAPVEAGKGQQKEAAVPAQGAAKPALVAKQGFQLTSETERIINTISGEIDDAQASLGTKVGGIFRDKDTGEVLGRQQSPYPDYFKNKGYTYKNVRNIIDKALSGKPLTEKQSAILNDLVEGKREEEGKQADIAEAENRQKAFEKALRRRRDKVEKRDATRAVHLNIVKEAKEEEEFYSGIPVKKLLEPFRWKAKPVNDTVNLPGEMKFKDPEVEKRWADAKGIKTPSLIEKGIKAMVDIKHSFQRKFVELDPQIDGEVSNILRVFEATPDIAKTETAYVLKSFIEGFGTKKKELFTRHIVLDDMVKDIERGLAGKDPDAPLRFGFKNVEDIKEEAIKYRKLVDANPDIKKAINRRNEFYKNLKQKLVDLNLLPEEVLSDDRYYHHQVLQYIAEKKAYPGLTSDDVRLKQKGFQKKRTGSELDYNTEYLEAEFEVISQSTSQIRTAETLQRLKKFDVTNKLKRLAQREGIENWQELIPEDYVLWQPKTGNVFYQALSINEKVAREVLEGVRELTEEDMGKIMALGAKRAQWVIPARYARTFDDLKQFTPEGPLANISAQAITSWKQWKLLNPLRAAKYMLNNMAGDLDIVLAYQHKILKQAPDAFRDLVEFHQGGPITGDTLEFFEEGGLTSGITMREIPDISQTGLFKLVAGEKPNLINRYWDNVKNFNNFRENLLRLAAYKYFKQELLDGGNPLGASKKAEIYAIKDINERAAKLARELLGDYGNISQGGNWMRRHMVPFYSWMEINAPRYVRMISNLRSEGRGGKKAGALLTAGRAVKFAFMATLMYSMVELWNRTAHLIIPGWPSPDELTDWQRRQHHIILGRREDGTVRSLRFQGALGDALDWFGLQDIVQDVEDVARGGIKALAEKAKELPLAPIERIVQGSRPFLKTAGEALLKKTLFPDLTNPRPIRDPWEHALQLIDANKPYRYIRGLPMKGLRDDVESLIFYISDPGASHYYNVRSYVYDYLKESGKEFPSVEPTKKANALYYYKQSLRYGEPEKAKDFLDEYKSLGGTREGLKISIKMAHPLYGIKNMSKFLETLTPSQKKEIETAKNWYTSVYGKR